MSVDPWMKWFPSDWRAEARLKMVSRAARSLWLDMLGLMHESVEYGFLLVGGVAPSAKQLAAILGDRPSDVTKWIIELEAVSVFSRDERGVIFSRRMVRDKAKRELDRENGKRGGRPSLNPTGNKGVNPPVGAQILEARVQKPEEKEVSVVPTSRPPKNALNGHKADFTEFYSAFPRHVAPRAAEKAYAKALSRASPETILAGAKRYATAQAREEPKFIQHPATWLNADRWMDEEGKTLTPLDPLKAAEVQDRADQLMRRGKYAEGNA